MKKNNFQLISYGLIFLGSSFLSLDIYADTCDTDADCSKFNKICETSSTTCTKPDGSSGYRAYKYSYYCKNPGDGNSSCSSSQQTDCGCK